MHFDGDVQIRKIRSKGKYGGVIFSAMSQEECPRRFVIKADQATARSSSIFREHHLWRVKGTISTQKVIWKDGSTAIESVITPTELEFVKSQNENLRSLLANSRDFKGISNVKAEKLVSFFGDELYQIAEANDIDRLLPILGREVAERLISGLQSLKSITALKILDDMGVPPLIGKSVLDIWENKAHEIIEKNPYLLISFMGDLSVIDAYAIDRLGFAEESPERVIGHAKNVLFDAFSSGNTCLPIGVFQQRLSRSLRSKGDITELVQIVESAGEIGVYDDLVQVKSMEIIESSVAQIIKHLSERSFPIDRVNASGVIDQFEVNNGFELTKEQRAAVMECCCNGITLLTGGAGCGKTTVLNVICTSLEELGQTSQIIMMALSGKAAQRITETTGREAHTIAGFLFNVDKDDIEDDAVIIVDEASMVDVLSLLQILRRLPLGGRIILTGDPEQLPPVGVGLGLHVLVENSLVNNPNLTIFKRQSSESGIPEIANKVRNFKFEPKEIEFAEYTGIGNGVSFIETGEEDLDKTLLSVYQELGGNGSSRDIMALSAVRSGVGGVNALNIGIHNLFSNGKALSFFDDVHGSFNFEVNGKALNIGDLVMYKRNDYQRDLRNGSIGKIVSQDDEIVRIDFDGNKVDFEFSDLSDLELAYAMTVHKSQGSQCKRVLVSIRRSRNLDRNLIYTALTRAQEQVVFVGSKKEFYKALGISNSNNRLTLLSFYLNNSFSHRRSL